MKQKNRYNPSMNYTDFFYYLVNYYLTSSKSTASLYEQLARTCCKYSANPKISIHKQPQLFTAKIQIYLINIVI